MSGHLKDVRFAIFTATAIAFGLGALSIACFVDVDESLIDKAARADARSQLEAAADEGGAADAALDAPYPGLSCGKTYCRPPGEVCCATTFGDPDIAHGVCSTSDLCESGDWFACESARDCEKSGLGDLLCCAVHVEGAFNVTKCASACEAPTSIFCEPSGRPCPNGYRCAPSTEFPSLNQCIAQ